MFIGPWLMSASLLSASCVLRKAEKPQSVSSTVSPQLSLLRVRNCPRDTHMLLVYKQLKAEVFPPQFCQQTGKEEEREVN